MRARFLLAALLVAQLADATTFSVVIPVLGIGVESNGIAAMFYHWQGMGGVLALKGAAIVLTIGLLVVAWPRAPRIFYIGGATGTTIGVFGAFTNVVALLLLA
jgi:phosphoglycerol transferase MdoB-like AlkP superfamily enzyme